MNERDLKKMLGNSFAIESELYDFCIECLKKLYPDMESFAIHQFEQLYRCREDYGCLQSLEYIDTRIAENLKSRAEYAARGGAFKGNETEND